MRGKTRAKPPGYRASEEELDTLRGFIREASETPGEEPEEPEDHGPSDAGATGGHGV